MIQSGFLKFNSRGVSLSSWCLWVYFSALARPSVTAQCSPLPHNTPLSPPKRIIIGFWSWSFDSEHFEASAKGIVIKSLEMSFAEVPLAAQAIATSLHQLAIYYLMSRNQAHAL
jgi:hypothetical protein